MKMGGRHDEPVEIELELLQRRVIPLAGQRLDNVVARNKGTLF